jgi:hypothetical protein
MESLMLYGLRAVGEDPSVTINSYHNVGFRKLSYIAVSKACVAAEKKNIADLFKAFDGNLLFSDQQQFLFVQEYFMRLVHRHLKNQ